jgi:hypothetical protein
MIYLTKDQVRLTLGLDNWLGWDFPSELTKGQKPTFGGQPWGGFLLFLVGIVDVC